MWPFDSEAPLDDQTSEFKGVTDNLVDLAKDSDSGLQLMQDAYNEYDFPDKVRANQVFTDASDRVRKKFGDTQPYSYDDSITHAPVDLNSIETESQDPEAAKLERINKWEQANLDNLDNSTELPVLQARSQLERGIKQAATQQRRDYYGKDNYIVTDLALRAAGGAITPLADLVGADSVGDFFNEQTDPNRDDSYWSAIASGGGSAVAAIGAGVATGGWGSVAYLGASGTGAVVKQVRDSLNNEGTVTEAVEAGGLEAVSQGLQVAAGEKVFGSVASKLVGTEAKSLGAKVFPKIAEDALLTGASGATAGVLGKEASNIGEDRNDDIFQGIGQNAVAGVVVGAAASGFGEIAGKKRADPIKELQSTIAETDGTLPPPNETIPGGRLSVDLKDPSNTHLTLDDGSQVVESNGNLHLQKDGNTLQPYEDVKYVKPEVADQLRQTTNSHAPDGTAITLTTDGDNLLAESHFVKPDLTIADDKTGTSRVVVPTETTPDGNVPVFVSKTRTNLPAKPKSDYETWYHGTPNPLEGDFSLDKADPNALYGPGIYTTSDPVIAGGRPFSGFEKGQNPKTGYAEAGTAYDSLVKREKLLERRKALQENPDSDPALQKRLMEENDHELAHDLSWENKPTVYKLHSEKGNSFNANDEATIPRETAKEILQKGTEYGKNPNAEINIADHYGRSSEPVNALQVLEHLKKIAGVENIPKVLSSLGYDSILHTGGKITGEDPHNVKIFFDPKDLKTPGQVHAEDRTHEPGIRQNPYMIAPGKVTDSTGAMKAGEGQKVSEFVQKKMKEYGPDLSENLGLSVTQYEQNTDGTLTSKQVPIETYFPVSHEETGNAANDFLNKNGLYKSMEHLTNLDRYNSTDQALAATIHDKLKNAYFDAVQNGNIEDQVRYGNLFGEAVVLDAKSGTEAGRSLGARTEAARNTITGRSDGDSAVNLIKTYLLKQGSEEFKKETGEHIDLNKFSQEKDIAEKNLAKASKGVKEGEPVPPEVQNEINKAKATYDKTVERLTTAQSKLKEKLDSFDPEAQKSLKTLTDVLKTVAPGTMQQAVADKIHDIQSKFITKDSSTSMFDKVFNFYRSNLLSGPSTEERSILGHFSMALSNVVGLVGSGQFGRAGHYAAEWLKATPQSFRNAAEIVKGNREGTFNFDQKFVDRRGNLKDNFKPTSEIPSINPLKNPLTFVQNTMFRLLKAQYSVFHRNAESAMAYLAEDIANKNEKNPALRRQLIENALYRSPEKLKEITDSINNQRDTLKKAGIELTDREIDNAKADLMEQSRSERTREIAGQHGERSTFSNDPTGITGAIYDTVNAAADKWAVNIGGTKVKPLKFVMPFTRVASNITSHIMEFTPVGLFKGAINSPEGAKGLFNHGLTAEDAKISLGRGIIGSTLLGGFMSLAYAYKDDKDPFIQFYGYPEGKEYDAWKTQGITPFSMKIGSTVIPLQGTSLAILPAILGGAMKNIRSGASIESVIKSASISSLGAVSTMSFLKPAGDLFDHIVGAKDQVTTESGSSDKRSSNFWLQQADTLATGFIPASGMLNNLGRWSNSNPVETYNNFSAKLLGDMPFTQSLGLTDKRPQLNMFGEPIEKPLVERLSAGLAPHTIKTDPVFLWMQETGYNVTDQGPIVRLSTKAEKYRFEDSQKEITGYKDIMDEAQSREVLEKSGPQIKNFLNNIKDNPSFQVLNKRNQEYINEYVNKIRARAKYEVLASK